MDAILKKSGVLLVVLFLGYWIIHDPTGMADTFKAVWNNGKDLLGKLGHGFVAFFKSFS